MTETPGNKDGTATPSLEDLARRLLDLWQDQLTAAAANPDLAGQAARLMAALPLPGMWLTQMGQMGMGPMGMGSGGMGGTGPAAGMKVPEGHELAKAWAEMARNWMVTTETGGAAHGSREPGPAQSATAPAAPSPVGTPPAAAASQPGSVDLDQLRARLASLEKRLGELDGAPAKPPKPKPAAAKTKRKSGPARSRDEGPGTMGPGS